MTAEVDRRRAFRESLRSIVRTALTNARELYWRHADIIGLATLLAFAIVVAAMAFLRPLFNWDMLAYIAATVRGGLTSAVDLHAYAYSSVREAVPSWAFDAMTAENAYRVHQFADPEAFVSMLGMYEMKWLYIALLKWFSPFLGPFHAAYFINCIALGILVVALGAWLKSTRLLGYAPLVVMLLFALDFGRFAGSQQPDALANALVIAALLAYDRQRNFLGSALMLLAVLTRPDQIATAGVLMACAWYLRDRAMPVFVGTFVAGLGAWFLIGQTTHGVGWWSHFWFSTYKIQDTMVGFHPDFSPVVYILSLGLNIYRSLFETTWLAAYGVALAVAGYLYFNVRIEQSRREVLLLAALLSVPAKFAVFPLADARIYFAQLAVFFLLALATQTETLRSQHGAAAASRAIEA